MWMLTSRQSTMAKQYEMATPMRSTADGIGLSRAEGFIRLMALECIYSRGALLALWHCIIDSASRNKLRRI